jgi:hypothetical protein
MFFPSYLRTPRNERPIWQLEHADGLLFFIKYNLKVIIENVHFFLIILWREKD